MLHQLSQIPVLVATDGTSDGQTSNFLSLLLPLLLIGAIFYFLMIRPQRRRMRDMDALRNAVTVGDEVRTVGGIFGTVREVDDDVVVIDVGGGTTLRLAKRAIAERLGVDEE